MNNEPNKQIRDTILNLFKLKNYNKIKSYVENLQITYPNSIFLLNILGVVNNSLENYEESIINFKKIIKINPYFADTYYNLGNVYKTIDNNKNSIENYLKCLKLNPNKFEAYNNLGNIYMSEDKVDLAFNEYLNCLKINPRYLIALQNFGICLQNITIKNKSELIDNQIINLFNENNILRPVDIVQTIINYIYLDSKFLFIVDNLYKIEKYYKLEDLIKEIYNNKILFELLKITPLTNLRIENLLKYLRSKILFNLKKIKNRKFAIKLMEAIAIQCFINEYIYSVSKNEKECIKKLENVIEKNLNNENKVDLEISCLASYKALNNYNWAKEIINYQNIFNLSKIQILEPIREKKLQNLILNKVKILNPVSIQVKDQYENNPYPRWNKISLNITSKNPIDFFENINIKFKKNKIKNWKNINVLVAGCGTGQHALTTAAKFKNSYVTAIDLSLKSLSYAKRKAEELKLNNIEFIQLDILDLISFKKKYHIIESVGVLHHMENPFKGWEILSKILHSNGLMFVGLYSKLARKHIEKFRKEFGNLNLTINDNNIVNLREEIIKSNNKDNELIKQSSDFYSLSNLRDLLFHVQEKRFDILEIEEYLKKLNFKFCGFQNKELIKLFKNHYKNDDVYDLKFWDQYEKLNPRSFSGMYQFWCQKSS